MAGSGVAEFLVGRELEVVLHVRDYIQLNFNGRVLNVYGKYEVARGTGPDSSGTTQPTCCELVSLINRVVVGVVFVEESHLLIDFGNGWSFTAYLGERSGVTTPESAQLVDISPGGSSHWWVWA